MKAQMLKMAGVKSEAAFYKKFPSQEAFMKVHGKEFKKAQVGTYINGKTADTPNLINFNDVYDQADLSITGKTNSMREEQAYRQAELSAKQNQGGGGMFDQLGGALTKLAPMIAGGAHLGTTVPKAQFGGGFNPGNLSVPSNIGYSPMSTSLTSSGFKMPDAGSGTMDKIGGAIGQFAGPLSSVVQGLSAIKGQKKAVKAARQTQQLSDLSLQASQTRPEQTQRQYVRPEDMVTSGNQVSSPYGTGTNILGRNGIRLKDGGEVQNTYAPNDLYDDLEYEPLYDSNQVKQYQNGGFPFEMAGNFASKLSGAFGNQDAGTLIGKGIGEGVVGAIPGIGQIPGVKQLAGAITGTIGGLIDTSDNKIKKAQAATDRNMQSMAFGQSAQGLQSQNASYMEDGGYMSYNAGPELMASFGDYSPEDVYDFENEGVQSMRAGGHLNSYTPPSERSMETFAMGGELQTHWGGHMEEVSENPYLPDGGVTYMPRGQSHDETNGKGQSGIGITYGDNPVEVERSEPIMKLKDGSTGEDNLVVFGNLKIPTYGVELLGDKKAKGMKFKNYVSDLSKSEVKQNKTVNSSSEELAELNPITSFDKLKFSGLKANILGANMKLKEIADTKNKAATLQNAINDTAEEYGFDADSLARGKVKTAKFGGDFKKAQNGIIEPSELDEVIISSGKKKPFGKPEPVRDNEIPTFLNNEISPLSKVASPYVSQLLKESPKKTPFDIDPYLQFANSILPNFRPSDSEELNRNQLLGEMYALSNNQEEPVQAQQFSPQLASSYSISLQDQMNEITAQTRAAQRMAQGNPSAQAAIATQAYEAINKVKGEEFRMKQGAANQVQTSNIAAINDAKLKNLGILDNQYTRQSQAKSNSKAVTQAALNSISSKYAQNSLENRKLQTYENMYNFRYDANGRAINMNGLAQFNTSGTAPGKSNSKGLAPGYEFTYDSNQNIIGTRKSGKQDARNGSIVKAMRNL
jgi:hypothetical protein